MPTCDRDVVLRVALPNKGSLADGARALVSAAGYSVERSDGQLLVSDVESGLEFVFVRPGDIAFYFAQGALDLGITGRDMLVDSVVEVDEILPLGFGRSRFYYAVPRESGLSPAHFARKRVATSFVNIVRRDLEQRGIEADIVQLSGAVEIAVRLGIADAVADVVQTGRTLALAGLQTVGDPVLESEAILVGKVESAAAVLFVERVRGALLARSYVLVEYDVRREMLERACVLTPGIEAPTISPLQCGEWIAVRSLIARSEAHAAMDCLGALGARAIVLSDILNCRL